MILGRLITLFRKFDLADLIAVFLSLLAVLLSAIVADRVYERLAHLEDEVAFIWQAQALAGGRLTVPSPPEPKSFLVPFVVDYQGQRFGKYPLGWPLVLSLGVRLGLRWLVNPLLGGLGVWLIYRLGKRVFGAAVGLIAAGLVVVSPFFLVNSGSLLSHPLGLVLSATFALNWLKAFGDPGSPRPWLSTLGAALSLSALALTRPLTAVAVAFPFALHGLYCLVRGIGPHAAACWRWVGSSCCSAHCTSCGSMPSPVIRFLTLIRCGGRMTRLVLARDMAIERSAIHWTRHGSTPRTA